MNSKNIKIIAGLVSVVFLALVASTTLLYENDDNINNIQFRIQQNFASNKKNFLKVDNFYYENYYKLNAKLIQDIYSLTNKKPKQLSLKEMHEIVYRQKQNRIMIEKISSAITQLSLYIKKLLLEELKKENYPQSKDISTLRELLMDLVDSAYDIKQTDDLMMHQFGKQLQKIRYLKLSDNKLSNYQSKILMLSDEILDSSNLLYRNIKKFQKFQSLLDSYYLDIEKILYAQRHDIKQKMKYEKIISVVLLLILIFSLIKLLYVDRNLEEEKTKLLEIIDKNINTSTSDLEGVATSVSEAYCKISGYKKDELLGKPHSIIRHPDMPKSLFEDMWKTIKSGKIWRGDIKNLKKDGGYYWADTTVEPIFDKKGDIKAYMAIRLDITNKVALNELIKNQDKKIKNAIRDIEHQKSKAQQASKAKSEFLANMSHEIRTPLNAILGFVDLLKEEDTGKRALKYINIIHESSQSLLQIIEDILDFSKIESRRLSIDKVDFHTKSELEVITYLFNAKCSKKDITLELNLSDNLPSVINTDPLRVKQIISNLISNAIKFTDIGKTIKVDVDYSDGLLHVSVEDEGIGISQDKLKDIFKAFNQGDSSTTRKYGGTGLGLSISSELTKLLGGELKVQSKEGVGSKFYFNIPVGIGKGLEQRDEADCKVDFNGKKILLAEDNRANQMFMKIILQKLNLKFDVANDGLEAIELFESKKYDAILMDENMPHMNGIEATKRILELEKQKGLSHTPIIALTANALKGDRERFLESGMDEYLTKPLKKDKLIKILEGFICQR